MFAEPSGMSLPNDHRPEAQSEGHATAMISVARASSASGAKSTLHGPEAVKQSGGAGAAGAAVTQGAQPKGNLVRELTRYVDADLGMLCERRHTLVCTTCCDKAVVTFVA